MKADTKEWVRYAEEDFDVASVLMRRRTKTAANTIGFHCQQCVEKYLKARLEEAGLPVPKVHSLAALLGLPPAAGAALGFVQSHVAVAEQLRREVSLPGTRRHASRCASGIESLPLDTR
jgi:HEPN domain-containing protein